LLRTYKLIAILALLIMVVLVSGCYTVVGHPELVEEGVIKEDLSEERSPGYYESPYGRPYLYYDSYYGLDSYYGSWYPGSRYYGGYYNDYYYSRDYYGSYGRYYGDYYLAPEKRPETRRRGASELRRPPRTEDRFGPRLEMDNEDEQSEKRVPNRRRVEKRTQKSSGQRKEAPSQRKRSRERKAPEEEE